LQVEGECRIQTILSFMQLPSPSWRGVTAAISPNDHSSDDYSLRLPVDLDPHSRFMLINVSVSVAYPGIFFGGGGYEYMPTRNICPQ
jgi:hypothetical protein